ncbi:MAG: hypothetical protein HQL06_01340 [Nitrospirae bacterium]|nr:hypothetical protein [Nitrospirota bacterium]
MRQTVITILVLAGVLITANISAQARDIPYTQEDRERIIRLEEGQKAIMQRIDGTDKRIDGLDKRIDGLDKRIDSLEFSLNKRIDELRADMKSMKAEIMTLMLWGFGILFGGMGLLMGFVLWDRHTALAPAIRKTKEVDERSELLVKVLKEVAAKNHDVKEALKHAGLL